MKATFVILSLTILSASGAPEDYVNFVRQVQGDTGVEWDVSVAPNGEMLSPEGVGEAGSLYELWSVHSSTASDYLLDQEFVSSFTPEVTIEIHTLDPYDVIPRTRVDQPFSASVLVGGLLIGSDAPIAAKQVLLTHEAFPYPDDLHGFAEGEAPSGHMVSSGYLDQNGEEVVDCPVSNIPGDDLTQVEGEEVFTAYALSDEGLGEEILDTALVQVWPIARAEITGINSGDTYDHLPPVQVILTDLYPDSETYVRVYKGSPDSESTPIEVEASYVIIEDVVPQDRLVTLSELDDLILEEGTYTFEVLHDTPFGTDLLDQVHPVVIDRTLTVRGSLFAKE
jgi:hypothetical protein